ncbi:unnamed protein product [Durusdinium trenchii]|uniref:Uncharacterized protein n=1 Tax=Durusdinium trenchii TaxID=1381693 RepID=A0ABP0QQK2_9DINO
MKDWVTVHVRVTVHVLWEPALSTIFSAQAAVAAPGLDDVSQKMEIQKTEVVHIARADRRRVPAKQRRKTSDIGRWTASGPVGLRVARLNKKMFYVGIYELLSMTGGLYIDDLANPSATWG